MFVLKYMKQIVSAGAQYRNIWQYIFDIVTYYRPTSQIVNSQNIFQRILDNIKEISSITGEPLKLANILLLKCYEDFMGILAPKGLYPDFFRIFLLLLYYLFIDTNELFEDYLKF